MEADKFVAWARPGQDAPLSDCVARPPYRESDWFVKNLAMAAKATALPLCHDSMRGGALQSRIDQLWELGFVKNKRH